MVLQWPVGVLFTVEYYLFFTNIILLRHAKTAQYIGKSSTYLRWKTVLVLSYRINLMFLHLIMLINYGTLVIL